MYVCKCWHLWVRVLKRVCESAVPGQEANIYTSYVFILSPMIENVLRE